MPGEMERPVKKLRSCRAAKALAQQAAEVLPMRRSTRLQQSAEAQPLPAAQPVPPVQQPRSAELVAPVSLDLQQLDDEIAQKVQRRLQRHRQKLQRPVS